jgi:hypothetical protein
MLIFRNSYDSKLLEFRVDKFNILESTNVYALRIVSTSSFQITIVKELVEFRF